MSPPVTVDTIFPLSYAMTPSRIRKKLTSGETVICAKVGFWSPEIVEMVCAHGFDGIWYCLEHRQVDPAAVAAAIQVTRLSGADAIMRVKPTNYTDLLWLLEAGARGIMLPRARSVAEIAEVVEAMKFPPLGRRGFDGVQAEADFGRAAPADYMVGANRENFLVAQIEEPEIVPHIDAMAALPGVDVLFVGPADLSLSMGKFGQLDDPEMVAVIEAVAAACARHGKVAGIPCAPEDVPKYHAMGYRFFNVVSDFRCMATGLKETGARLGSVGFALDEA